MIEAGRRAGRGGEAVLTPNRVRAGARLFLAPVAGLLVLLPSGGTPLAASPFTVDSQADAVDANVGDGTCATAAGECTLRAAIQEANALAGGAAAPQQTINLSAGTYPLTIAGRGEDDAAAGDLDVKANITIKGAGAATTVIDAGQSDRALDVGSGTTVEVVGVSITNGLLTQGSEAGAGIQNRGQLTLDSVSVHNNQSGASAGLPFFLTAGGIQNHQGGTLTLLQSSVSNNRANNGSAGIVNGGSMRISDSSIHGNEALGTQTQSRANGGGITNTSQGTAEITGSTISGNVAWRGAGIYLNSGSMTLINSTISGNSADREGGAIYASGAFRVVNGTVSKNVSHVRPPTGGSGGTGDPRESIYMLSGTATFRGTIIDQGPSGCGQQSTSTPAFVSEGFNIDRGASCGLAVNVTLCPPLPAVAGGDKQNVDPLLGPLGNNGGPTPTHALPPTSPAIDRVPAHDAPATDQRGIPRPQYPPCRQPPCHYALCSPWTDAGAYELVNTTNQILTLDVLRPRSTRILTENLVLRVEGQGFLPGATVNWNGAPLPTKVHGSTQVEAEVKPEMFPRCGEYSITASNPGADPSSRLSFHVDGCRPLR